jgi:peptidoglycan/LPS O-acetylase OafA/YrhL
VLWTGKRSYAIYLWHFPLISLAIQHGYGRLGKVAAVALAVLAAALSWRLVEQPFLRLKKRFEPTTPKHAAHPRSVNSPIRQVPLRQDATPHTPEVIRMDRALPAAGYGEMPSP